MEGSAERTKRAIDAVFGSHVENDEDVIEDDDEGGDEAVSDRDADRDDAEGPE